MDQPRPRTDPTAPEITRAELAAAVPAVVRAAASTDAAEILAIHNLEVTDSTVLFDLVPRTLPQQRQWLDDHAGGHPAVVAVDEDGAVVGYGSLSTFHPRPAYATTVEDSVYIRRDLRGLGIGQTILEDLVRRATAHGFHSMIARIVDQNQASIALHEACGFELVGIEREVGRKFGRWLDVVELQLLL